MNPSRILPLFALSAGLANAQTYELTLASLDRGWVNSDGYGSATNTNYITGATGSTEYRSYFMFDASSIEGQVVAASLVLTNPLGTGYISDDSNEIVALHQVTSSIPQASGAINDVAVFNDLGDGTIYGLGLANAATGELVINLDSYFLDDINASGPVFTLGAALASLNGDASDTEAVFGFSTYPEGSSPSPVRLLLTVDPSGASVPEPSVGLLGLLGLAGLLRRKR